LVDVFGGTERRRILRADGRIDHGEYASSRSWTARETTEELRSAKWGLLVVERVADDWGRISEGGIWAEFQLGTPESGI
jgi:hypothetical protein